MIKIFLAAMFLLNIHLLFFRKDNTLDVNEFFLKYLPLEKIKDFFCTSK